VDSDARPHLLQRPSMTAVLMLEQTAAEEDFSAPGLSMNGDKHFEIQMILNFVARYLSNPCMPSRSSGVHRRHSVKDSAKSSPA